MPVYEYECKACHRDFEYQQRMSDPDKTVCEACGGALERLISRTAFTLKGGGWYKDLYSSVKPDSGGSDKSSGSDKPASSSSDASSSAATPSSTPAASGSSSSGGSSSGGSSSGSSTPSSGGSAGSGGGSVARAS